MCDHFRHFAQLNINSARQAAHGWFISQKAESQRALLAVDYTVVGESDAGVKDILVFSRPI